MKIFRIEFIQLFKLLERVIQTFAVLQWLIICLIIPFICLILLIYSLFTSYWYLSLLYLLWMYYDSKTHRTGGRPIKWFKNLKIWEYYRDYFPISLVKSTELDPNKNYIFGFHPHGILGCSAFCNFCTGATGFSKLFPGIRPTILTLKINLYYPVLREYLSAFGVCDVSKESLHYLLTECGVGNAAVIVIGGAEEALDARPDSYVLTLRNRKGFIKTALETGASLVPCFGFNENELFHQFPNPKGSILRAFQEYCKILFHTAPRFYHGRGIFNETFGMMPYRKPLITVIGKPINVTKERNPSKEAIEKLHTQYLESLNELFEENKLNYGVHLDKHLVFE